MSLRSREWQFLFLTLAVVLKAVRQSEVKKQNNSFLLDTIQTKRILRAEDAIVRINQRIFRYEKPWRNFLIEGDIVKPLWRNAVVSDTRTWQKSVDGMVRIPYEISQQYDEETWSSISRGFKDFEKFTCVRFVSHSDEEDFISIQPIHGCYSSVGRVGGMQLMSLNHQCLKKGKGVVEHEIMHALGFWHEHARSDRGKYIKIEWKNVWPGYEHNFLKQNTNNLETKYDYGSILHYSRTAFSKNGQPTLRPLIDTDTVIGQRNRLSELDLLKVNRLYNCTMHLKDKANVLKRLPLLNESGSLRELGRTKEAERLKPLLDISPETAKARVHTPAQLVVSLRGNASTLNQTIAIVHEYPKCILLRKCAPISQLIKSRPEVYNTSIITAFKESATEASEGQSRPISAQIHKGKAKTFLLLPFAQSPMTNSLTTHSPLHVMTPTLAQRSLTRGPALRPKACVRCCTKEHVLHPNSQNLTDHIESLAGTPHTVKSDTQTQATVGFLADLLTTGQQDPRPVSWSDLPDTHAQTSNVAHQAVLSVGLVSTLTNLTYPLIIPDLILNQSHQQKIPFHSLISHTQKTGHLKSMNPASQFEMPPRPLQASISIKETMGAPEILFREFHNRMVTQRKALTGSSYKKKLPFLLKTGSPAHWYKAFNSRDLLLTAIPNPVGTLLVSTPTTVGASTRPGDNLLLSTPPSETLPVSTPPTGSLLLSTPPADTLPVSTPPADILPVSTHSAKTLTVSIPPVETLPVSTPPTDSLPVSTSPAEILPVSTPHTEILPVSTPPADSLPVSIPSADTLPVSTTHAETLPVSTPPTDSLPVSTPPAEILPVSTPRADSLPVSTLAGDTLPMSTLPADTLSVSIPFAETLPVSIPPTDTLPVSIPTAEALPVSSPPTDDLTVSTPPADSLPVSTPPAEILPVSTPLTFVLPVSTPAETLHMSTFPAEALPVSNPPTGDLPVSTPPTDSLPVSTPPAETLPVSTPLAETLPVSILSAESLPGSTSPTDTLPVSNPSTDILPTAILPNETVLASTSSPKILLASFSFVANSAATIQSIISPFTLTTRNNPVTINPLYNVPLISPTQSVLPDNLPVELFCDFEHGLCDWEQSTTDDFDWVLHRYQTFSRETGPKRDHTKGQCKRQGGHYLYLKGSYSQLSGEQAALISPPLREQKCLTFWYNMFGKHMGSLNVFLKYEHTTSWHKLWSVSGNQGRKWLNAEIDIFTNGDKFRVIIEGVLGPSYQSDAAIDDVQIYRNNCDSSWKHWNPTCNRGLKKRNKSHLG